VLPSVARRSDTVHTSSTTYCECLECIGMPATRLRRVCTYALNMGGIWGTCVAGVTRRSSTVHTSSTTYGECQECTGMRKTRLRRVWTHVLNMGALGGTCVAQCHTSFWHRTHVVHDALGVLGVYWNAHNSSPRSVKTCTQHGGYMRHMCCPVLHIVLGPYTHR